MAEKYPRLWRVSEKFPVTLILCIIGWLEILYPPRMAACNVMGIIWKSVINLLQDFLVKISVYFNFVFGETLLWLPIYSL